MKSHFTPTLGMNFSALSILELSWHKFLEFDTLPSNTIQKVSLTVASHVIHK
jgi:hypothetical protein